MNSKYRLVLFDLDGVIIDSKRNMELSWLAVQTVFELNVPFEKYFKLIGRPFNDIMVKLGLDSQADRIKRVYDVSSSSRIDLIDFYDNCPEVIRKIKENCIRVGIVTSKDETRTLEIVKRLDIFDGFK